MNFYTLRICSLIKENLRQNLSRLPRRSFDFAQDLLAMTTQKGDVLDRGWKTGMAAVQPTGEGVWSLGS